NTKQIVATPGAEVFVFSASPSADALTQSTSDELSPTFDRASDDPDVEGGVGSSVAELERVKRVDFAADIVMSSSDREDQGLFSTTDATLEQQQQQQQQQQQPQPQLSGHYRRNRRIPPTGDDGTKAAASSADDNRLRTLSSSARYAKPRMSLLGKPLGLKNSRQDAKYRRLQARVYNFLERPKTWQSITYHVIVFASVFICLVFSVLSTMTNCVRDHRDPKDSKVTSSGHSPPPTTCSKNQLAFKHNEIASEILFYMETGMLFWFFTEYCLRMWSAGCRSRYQGWRGRLLFARRPFCIRALGNESSLHG
uniref:Ion_trans domain-containing protein n=1 Tax=Macrostomum lignano TaxID=282301 RepID=A0A1I8G2L1_9PLAT